MKIALTSEEVSKLKELETSALSRNADIAALTRQRVLVEQKLMQVLLEESELQKALMDGVVEISRDHGEDASLGAWNLNTDAGTLERTE